MVDSDPRLCLCDKILHVRQVYRVKIIDREGDIQMLQNEESEEYQALDLASTRSRSGAMCRRSSMGP